MLWLIESYRREPALRSLRRLIRDWAPLVWLAPGERFLPLGVTEFLDNVQSDQYYLRTRIDVESLLKNRSSFLYGRKPAGTVPVYALVKKCVSRDARLRSARDTAQPMLKLKLKLKLKEVRNVFAPLQNLGRPGLLAQRQIDSTNNLRAQVRQVATVPRLEKVREKNGCQKVHFHVTYWMFYPFSEGKTICVLDLGFFGSWPIPTVGGVCIGTLKEYGSHIGDWEHMSLYFKVNHASASRRPQSKVTFLSSPFMSPAPLLYQKNPYQNTISSFRITSILWQCTYRRTMPGRFINMIREMVLSSTRVKKREKVSSRSQYFLKKFIRLVARTQYYLAHAALTGSGQLRGSINLFEYLVCTTRVDSEPLGRHGKDWSCFSKRTTSLYQAG
ncbi:uncharacterized protein [Temnothorax longispinosus]|uniref:uncharacterized protein isoform X2 n=1 Tax=Temnothorax longispinosus TaxID=300112 RepID=UPI003A99C6EF